jgi:hypothetical protein
MLQTCYANEFSPTRAVDPTSAKQQPIELRQNNNQSNLDQTTNNQTSTEPQRSHSSSHFDSKGELDSISKKLKQGAGQGSQLTRSPSACNARIAVPRRALL